MSQPLDVTFDQPDLAALLDSMSDEALNPLPFGVIGMDGDALVQRYNSLESELAGLSPQRVLGFHLFTHVAPCMNNFLVAQRFEDAQANAEPLDATIDYVLTLRMRPKKVKLRLLATPGGMFRYVLVNRS